MQDSNPLGPTPPTGTTPARQRSVRWWVLGLFAAALLACLAVANLVMSAAWTPSAVDNMFFREWEQILSRDHGPLAFRFILQPTVAALLALRAGLRDTRERRAAFFWAVVSDPAHRGYLVAQGWKDVGKVFLFAMLLDVIYQVIVLHWVYPAEMLVVATVLAIVPYLVVRGPINRVAALFRR